MTRDAVVLTRLEWERLVSCGWLRLHNIRLVRVHDWLDPIIATVNFAALMESAPDVGMSSSDYVLAELHYEVWPPISQHNFQLGRMIKLEQVQRFSCFDERACKVLNATYNGAAEYATKIFQQPTLWTNWRGQIFKAWENNRVVRFLAHFNFSLEKSKQESNSIFDELINTQGKLSGNNYYEHAKGTRAFGWITALATSKKKCNTKAGSNVEIIIKNLKGLHHVDDPFFAEQSIEIADYVSIDTQYEKIGEELVVFAAYAHYAYLIERSGYKKFSYEAFCKDVAWLEEKHIDLAVQLVKKIARCMVDELLWHVVSMYPSVPARPAPAALENSPVPPTAPVPDSAVEPETPSASDIAPTPETPLALPVAEHPSEKPAPQTEAAVPVADSPEVQESTTVVDERVEAPETPIEPAEAVSETSDQPKNMGPEAGQGDIGREKSVPVGQVEQSNTQGSLLSDPVNEYFLQSPSTKSGNSYAPTTGKNGIQSELPEVVMREVASEIRTQASKQGGDKKAYKYALQDVVKRMKQTHGKLLTQAKVKDWAKKSDLELAKQL